MSITAMDRARVGQQLRDVLLPWVEQLDTERAREQDEAMATLRECMRGVVEQLADLAALTTDAEQLDAALEAVEACGDENLTKHYRLTERNSRMCRMRDEQRERAERDTGARGAA